jgi:hypothetical protein
MTFIETQATYCPSHFSRFLGLHQTRGEFHHTVVKFNNKITVDN